MHSSRPINEKLLQLQRDELHLWVKQVAAKDLLAQSKIFLREVLGSYLECGPKEIEFGIGPHGKPYLTGGGLEFNVSHSVDHIVIALSWEQPIGVDLERLDLKVDWEKIGKRYLTASEYSFLETMPEEKVRQEFMRLWTAKEALVKALGVGVSALNPGFEISEKHFWIEHFDQIPGFITAVACKNLPIFVRWC